MFGLMQRITTFFLEPPKDLTNEYARQYIFFRTGAVVASLTHATWALVFALNGNAFMAWYNLCVTGLFAYSGWAWLRWRGPMWLMLGANIAEISFHGLLATIVTGNATLFWLMALIPNIVVFLVPQWSWLRKSVLAGLITLLCCGYGVMGFFVAPLDPLPFEWTVFLFAFNFCSVASAFVLYLGMNQYLVLVAEKGLTEEFNRAEGLLRNILPEPVALRLKNGERVIANEHREVSVIFADIVNFTSHSASLSPGELVETLNDVFSAFDGLADQYGAEKIKTIGDAYMVVVGAPDETKGHAEVAVEMAMDMRRAVAALRDRLHFDVQIRIGVNSGAVVAGVIGRRKFAYDLWGDAVNVAARMESHSEPGQILITETTARLLPDRIPVVSEGVRDVKGKGAMAVFSVSPQDVGQG